MSTKNSNVVNLWGDDFIISEKETIQKISQKIADDIAELIKNDPEKALKSKKVPIKDKIEIIRKNVYEILGKQVNNVVTIRSVEDLHNYISQCILSKELAVDTETNNSTVSANCDMMGLCLYYPGGKQAYIPCKHIDIDTGELLPNQLTYSQIAEELKRLSDIDMEFDYHNFPFDFQVMLHNLGITLWATWDTQTAARVLNENEKASLKWQYSNKIDSDQKAYKIESLFAGLPYAIIPPELFAIYAATDSFDTYKLKVYQQKKFQDPTLADVYKLFINVEMPVNRVVAKMESRGVTMDEELVKALSTKYNQKLKDIDENIQKELVSISPIIDAWRLSREANTKPKKYGKAPGKNNEKAYEKWLKSYPEVDAEGNRFKYGKTLAEQLDNPINLASPSQLAILLYDILKCPAPNKDSPRGTGEDELLALQKSTKLPLCSLILSRRGVVKLLSTYIDNIPEILKLFPDHRMRSHFNPLGADTGRFSSGGKFKFLDKDGNSVEISGVNLQNVPAHEKAIRMYYTAAEGKLLVGSDYSAQEPRLTAFYSQDKEMLEAYTQGKDLYSVIASSMYNNKYEDNLEFYPEGTVIEIDGKKVTCGNKTHLNKAGKARRFEAKSVLIGLLYGRGAASIAEQITENRKDPNNICTPKDAQDIIDRFFKAYPSVKNWIEETKKYAREHGEVHDWYGRIRRLPDINLPKFSIKYKEDDDKNTVFNPLLGCSNRVNTALIEKYQNILDKCKSKKDIDDVVKRAGIEGLEITNNSGFIALAERQCVNARVQGGAATLTKLAMINIDKDPELNKLGFELLITVHDEVLGECPAENAEAVAKRLTQVMIDTAKPYMNVPMKCDPSIVKRWYADEYQSLLRDEIKHYEDGDPKKGITPLSHEESLIKLYKDHPEVSSNRINALLSRDDAVLE